MKPFWCLLVLPLAGCGMVDVISTRASGGGAVVGTGKAISEDRKAESATAVVASGTIRVTLRKGSPKLVVSAQREILAHLRTEFKNGTLTAWVEGSSNSSEPIRLEYTAPDVSSLEGSGATTFDGSGFGGTAGKVTLSGASKANVEGKVGTLTVEASGASQADLRSLRSERVKAEASGASKILLGATGRLDATANGASQIRYPGGTNVSSSDVTGASTITASS